MIQWTCTEVEEDYRVYKAKTDDTDLILSWVGDPKRITWVYRTVSGCITCLAYPQVTKKDGRSYLNVENLKFGMKNVCVEEVLKLPVGGVFETSNDTADV